MTGTLNAIYDNINNKKFSDSAHKLYDQLVNGFLFDQQYKIKALPKPQNNYRLPKFNDQELKWVEEKVLNQLSDIIELTSQKWRQKIEQFGDNYQANNSNEIKDFFDLIIDNFNRLNSIQAQAVIKPGIADLSWNPADLTIKIGANREAIDSLEEMLKIIVHEFGVHGIRTINALENNHPLLAMGLVLDTDYLAFEEGLATVLEAIIDHKTPEWNSHRISKYLGIALANRGYDFREFYELSWRYRVLMELEDNQELDPDFVLHHKRKAYRELIRIFRGNQPRFANLTYNKDLAYLKGRVLVMEYFKQLMTVYDSDEYLEKLFVGKFDPTNQKHLALVERWYKNNH